MSDTLFSRMMLISISALDHFLKWTALICGGATLTFMTGFSVWNVLIMRKAINAPITGAEDLLLLALVTMVALSIPLVFWSTGVVRVGWWNAVGIFHVVAFGWALLHTVLYLFDTDTVAISGGEISKL